MTGLDIRTGETVWQARGFARAGLLHAEGKTIIMDEDGDLALASLTPDGMTVLARASVFETVAWSAPTVVGTRSTSGTARRSLPSIWAPSDRIFMATHVCAR